MLDHIWQQIYGNKSSYVETVVKANPDL
nr:tail protein X [Bartonella sp. HY038]